MAEISSSAPPPRGIRIQQVVADRGAVTMAELVEATGIPSSAAYRQVNALVDAQLLARSAAGWVTGGPLAVVLAAGYRSEAARRDPVFSHLERLARTHGEFVGYMNLVGSRVLCVEAYEGTHTLRCSYARGRTQPVTRGASAVALLMQLDDADRAAVLDALHTDAATRARIADQVAEATHQGYAVSAHAVDTGVWGVSFPLGRTASDGDPAAFTVMVPAVRAPGVSAELIAAGRSLLNG